MYNILLLSHGSLAEEFKETLGLFMSNNDYVYAIGLKDKGIEKFNHEVCDVVKKIYDEDKGILILTDLYGGSPFNMAINKIKPQYRNVEVLAGLNLPMLVEARLMEGNTLKETVDSIIENKQNYISMFEVLEANEDDE
jgi:PTS system mannose-specific IIA component